jgi:hypothetical protein
MMQLKYIILCFFSIIVIAGLLFHKEKQLYSYHILKDVGNNTFEFWWPHHYFGEYCSTLKTAEDQFDFMISKNPNDSFRLVRYYAMVHWNFFMDDPVFSIYGKEEVLRENFLMT